MTGRPAGHLSPCSIPDARARLHDAEAFLDTAEMARDPDVVATNAIHATIAAADAICCVALRERSSDHSHTAAVDVLGRVDTKLANALARALSRKTQAASESRDIARRDATTCVRQATVLVDAARQRILGA